MRAALVRAAHASPGVVSDLILAADKRIKRKVTGGWFVLNRNKRRGKGGRRNRT